MNQDQAFAEKVLHVIIPEGYIGILKKDGAVQKVLTETEYYYWNVWNRLEVELLDMREPETAAGVSKAYLSQIPLKYYKKVEIQPGEVGILYYDNQVVRELETGTYYFWVYSKDVLCRVVDFRPVAGLAGRILPFYPYGLGWVLPAVLGFAVGTILAKKG